MKIHREGKTILISTIIILIIVNILAFRFSKGHVNIFFICNIISVIIFLLFLQFFRLPTRSQSLGDNLVIAPADGKVVVIEQTLENEFFQDKRILISIFIRDSSKWKT